MGPTNNEDNSEISEKYEENKPSNNESKDFIDEKIKYWKKKLIDLSKRNNLISYRFTKSKSIKIGKPKFTKILEDLQNETIIPFLKEEGESSEIICWKCWEDESVTNKDKLIDKKLTNLYYKARENFKELGINTLFVSLGILYYKDSDLSRKQVKAPIFLYPVQINRRSRITKNFHRFEILSESEEISLNFALKEKLFNNHGIELKDFDGKDPEKYFEYLKQMTSGLHDWDLRKEVYLDIFYFQKLIMYQDLIKYESIIKNNALIQRYIGKTVEEDLSDFKKDKFNDTTSIDVFEADSSQKIAIELAKTGKSFVLQGPPGTGKSQTIANIIAALMKQNKKILFVSQKMAALEVVQDRLDKAGLGRYCLNLHTYKGQKKQVINQLLTELQSSPKISDKDLRYSLQSYLDEQKQINTYYKKITKKYMPWNLSIYELRGEIAKYHDVEYIDIKLDEFLKLGSDEFQLKITKLKDFNEILNRVENPVKNPLYLYKKEKTNIQDRSEFANNLHLIIDFYEQIREYLDSLEDFSKLKVQKIEDFELIYEIKLKLDENNLEEVPDFLFSKDFLELHEIISFLFKNMTKLKGFASIISNKTKTEFMNVDFTKQEQIINSTSFINRLFNKEYKEAIKVLNEYATTKLGHKDWTNLLLTKKLFQKILNSINEFIKENKNYLKNIGDYEDLDHLTNLFNFSSSLFPYFKMGESFGKDKIYLVIKYLADRNNRDIPLFKNFFDSIGKINTYFDEPVLLKTGHSGNLDDFSSILYNLDKNLHFFDDILDFKETFMELNKNLQKFIKLFLAKKRKTTLINALLKNYYTQVLNEILGNKTIRSPKRIVKRFREDDLKVRDINRKKLMYSLTQNKPQYDFQTSKESEVSILKREGQKKRRLKPIRDLLRQVHNLAFALKPCFMMSPLSVSQYIDPELIKFDIVIFDEASQIMPQDAVVCLMRGNQAVIMGDTQQLPPTTFFMSMDDDEDIDESIIDLDSFLHEASHKFPEFSLEWHYRSKNENLIAFSNHQYYNNRLITFPNPTMEDDTGVELIYVQDGIYDRGKSRKNKIEATEVVNIYKKIRKSHPQKSIGIVAFNIAQQNAIREAFILEGEDFDENIDTTTEDLFIKNLETVQGDERDIIILSFGYGKDSTGKLSYNFGPLNRQEGYKRLNVAITRSRYKTIIVSSITPDHLNDTKLRAKGAKDIKNYMTFAKTKNLDVFTSASEDLEFDSNFEESVYDALINEGYEVISQVGCSGYRIDLAIVHPKDKGKYILGVECDGSQYHSSLFARDRDKVRQAVLEALGWNIHRIWSDDWINNRKNEIQEIKNKVQKILGKKKNN
ncbi:MAG: DUF4011 domain-containing protein [Candidatus Helarchaeota archaeon]